MANSIIQQSLQKRKDLIRQNYLSNQINYVVCMDITKLDTKHNLLCCLDLAARNIIGHCFLDSSFTVQHVLDTLNQIIKDRDFLPKIQILHSDRESLFKNEQYYDFLDKQNIQISRAAATGHGNQVIERTLRTIKHYMKKRLNLEKNAKHITLGALGNFNQKALFVKEIIEFYNNKPHKTLFGMTPNYIKEALFIKSKSNNMIDSEIVPYLAKNNQDDLAKQMRNYQADVVEHFVGDWRDFFVNFRDQTLKGLSHIISQNNQLSNQNENLFQQNKDNLN